MLQVLTGVFLCLKVGGFTPPPPIIIIIIIKMITVTITVDEPSVF